MDKTADKNNQKFSSSMKKKNQTFTIIKNIHKLFHKKYAKSVSTYNKIIIDNIIYNEKSHIVATFKDYLIIDDIGEFLKRFYYKGESKKKLKKFFEYYDLYSKIFPNYTAFNEGKYLYQNIQKKQRMIDLQEKMEMEKKKKEEKEETYSSYSDSKENVFSTDVINSILNKTNNETLNNLFDVNKEDLDIQQDEENFGNEVNNIINEINKYEPKKKKIENISKAIKLDKNPPEKNNIQINFNKVIRYNNNKSDYFINNIYISNNIINNNNNNKIEPNKENMTNKNIGIPININYTKNKGIFNSNSSSIINNNNITYYNDIRTIVNKCFNNNPSFQKNMFLNFNNKTNKNSKIENLEKNLFKRKQNSILFKKNSSQNISTSNQTQKDVSLSKKNSIIIYNKILSNSSSVKQNQKNLRKNINNFSSYKIKNNNVLKNIEKRNKGITPLASRNPKSGQLGLNNDKSRSAKNIKENTYYISDSMSRNKYTNNLKNQNKMKSSIMRTGYSLMSKINQSQMNKFNQKKIFNNTKIKLSETKNKIGYKEINFLRNQNSRNRNEIKEKILNNNSRNYNHKSLNRNSSQSNSIISKKTKNLNESSIKLGIMDIMNVKKNLMNGFNIQNFSRALNSSHIKNNQKNNFSKTYRENYIFLNK